MKATWVIAVVVLAGTVHGQAWLREIEYPDNPHGITSRVAGLGDVDGDGVPDMAAAPGFFATPPAYGRVYSGATGAQLFQFDSSLAISDFSMGLAAVGDVNDDGVTDIGFLADHPFLPESALTTNLVEVFSSVDGAPLIAVAEADPADQFYSFCGMGDLNGDGHDDLAVGAVRGQSAGQELGYVRLFSGADGAVLKTFWASSFLWFGSAVADAGDFDGDGLHDVAIVIFDHWTAENGYGQVQVLSSADGSVLLDLLPASGEYWGWSLAGPGDVNGDSVPDLLVGDIGFQQLFEGTWYDPPGEVLLYSGASGAVIGFWQGPPDTSTEAGHEMGSAISVLDDMDGDGARDYAFGSREGRTRIVSGASHALLYKSLPGYSGGSIGDVDGDGFGDVGLTKVDQVSVVRLAPWGSWLSGGLGLGGLHGVPVATGSGQLDGGDLVTLALTNARESSPTFLVLGSGILDAPFKGGILFPKPVGGGGLLIPMATNGAGAITLSATWPASVPAGFVLFYQFWIADPAGPHGFAASNVITSVSL